MTKTAEVYGDALYDLALEEGNVAEVKDELDALKEAFCSQAEFLRILGEPSLPKAERLELVEGCLGGRVSGHVLNFLKVLTEQGRTDCFNGCCERYRQRFCEDNEIIEVSVVSAAALTPELRDKLSDRIAAATGKKPELRCSVDADCLGGIRVDICGKRIDGTLRTRLNEIKDLLKNTVL